MAFVHPLSSECLKSELDLFSVPMTQTSIESASYVEYNPISTLTDGTPIEFVINGSGQDYLDLANTHLYVKAQILKANSQPIDANSEVGPVNLILQSLFSEVDIKLNDVLITSTNNTYAYRAYLETLLSYGSDAKNSQLGASLFIKDEAGKMENANPREDDANVGLKKRHSYFTDGRNVDLLGRLHADLFYQQKYIPNDVTLRIRLIRSPNNFCLMSSTPNENYKIHISECKIYVRRVKISPSVFVAHAKALEYGSAKYPIHRIICKTYTVPRGNLDSCQENVFAGQLPTRLVIGCVDNDAFNGNYEKNPFNFKHYNMSQLKVYLDGQQQTVRPLELNFANSQYVTAYMSLFTGTGKQFEDAGNGIHRDDYARGYTLYAFDLTPDLSEDDHFNLVREGNVRIDMKFSVALPNTINVIVYAEFENIIEIDRTRNVKFDYSE